jgi:parallel beta-helix repeat protein
MRAIACVALSLLLLLAAAPVALGATITVGPGGYSTIQDALNASADGDTVQIGPGTYAEAIVVETEVALEGSPAGGAVLMPAGGYSARVNASNVRFRSLRFEGAVVGIHVDGFAGLEVENCSFFAHRAGVFLRGADGSRILNSTFEHCLVAAVDLEASDGVDVLFNTINDSIYGIRAGGASRLNASGNDVTNTTRGICLEGAEYGEAGANRFNRTNTCIYLYASDHSRLYANEGGDTNVFIETIGSNNNTAWDNDVSYGRTYARETASFGDRYDLGESTVAGLDYEFARRNCTPPQGYALLGDAVDLSIAQGGTSSPGFVALHAIVTPGQLAGLNNSTLGYYRLDAGAPAIVSAASPSGQDTEVWSVAITANGTYALMAMLIPVPASPTPTAAATSPAPTATGQPTATAIPTVTPAPSATVTPAATPGASPSPGTSATASATPTPAPPAFAWWPVLLGLIAVGSFIIIAYAIFARNR